MSLTIFDSKHISSDDVTMQVVDVTARIKARQAVEAHLLTLLDKARTLEDIFRVEAQINAVREQIEVAEAQRLNLTRQAALATITLRYYQPLPTPPMEWPDAPTASFWPRMAQAFYSGWSWLLGLLVGLTHLWPLWTFGPALYFLWTRVLRTRLMRL